MTDLTLGDVLDVEYPGAPAWNDDGTRVAATLYEDDGKTLILATPDDDATHRLSPGDGFVTDFAWRPESDALAVTTDAEDLFLVDAATRETRRLEAAPDGISSPTWDDAGERLAYYRGSRLVVRSLGDDAVRALDVPENDNFLSEARMLAWDDAGERLAYRFVDRETTQVGVVDVESGELTWRTDDLASTTSPDWTADGRIVLDRRSERGARREVVVVDPSDGAETVLAEEFDDHHGATSMGAPEVSPDGTRVALAWPFDGWDHVAVADVETGDLRQLTDGDCEDKGLAGSTPQWVDDDTLVFSSNRRDSGQRQVFAVDVDGGVDPVVTSQGTNVHPTPSPDGDRVAYVHADRERSAELRVGALATDNGASAESSDDAVRLTESVVDDWPVDPVEPEHHTFESHDGREIHGYLVDPRGESVPEDATDLPAVVWVHGGPMRQMRDGWHTSRSYGLAYTVHQYLARQGYVGFVVNYRGGIGYGREFRRAIADSYGRDEFGDVVAAADYLRDRSFVDADALGIWGLSYGGYATLQILGTDPEAFDVGINLAGLADIHAHNEWVAETKYPAVAATHDRLLDGTFWESRAEWDAASPLTHMADYESPLYSFHGTGDRYVAAEQQDMVVERLLELDKEFEAEYYPGEGHVYGERAVWERTLRKIEDAFEEHLR
jgi:dipeptidyl aminopeptidase/acylaminoacyl peptidase